MVEISESVYGSGRWTVQIRAVGYLGKDLRIAFDRSDKGGGGVGGAVTFELRFIFLQSWGLTVGSLPPKAPKLQN